MRWRCLGTAAVWTATDAAAVLACTVCFGDPNSAQVRGAEAGIIVLFGVVAAVLLSIAAVGLFWVRRARNVTSSPHTVNFPETPSAPGLADAD
jgi:Na+/proline symporter